MSGTPLPDPLTYPGDHSSTDQLQDPTHHSHSGGQHPLPPSPCEAGPTATSAGIRLLVSGPPGKEQEAEICSGLHFEKNWRNYLQPSGEKLLMDMCMVALFLSQVSEGRSEGSVGVFLNSCDAHIRVISCLVIFHTVTQGTLFKLLCTEYH